jgi:hypothetical protein
MVNGFKSWLIKDTLFRSSMAKIKLGQELDGQNGFFPLNFYMLDVESNVDR